MKKMLFLVSFLAIQFSYADDASLVVGQQQKPLQVIIVKAATTFTTGETQQFMCFYDVNNIC